MTHTCTQAAKLPHDAPTLRTGSRVTYAHHWLSSVGFQLSQSPMGTIAALETFLGHRMALVRWDSGELTTIQANALAPISAG